ncbi:MAG: hypothetical protein JJU33_03915 [Phycisphaerales bacterium]|nr:hypothetical protein [Phycisphaerales bacterium]
MNGKLRRKVSVLAGVMVAVGLGACAGQERAGQTPRQAAPETRTDLTMNDLAGEWAFDAAEAEAALIEMAEATIAEIDDPAQRREARALIPNMTQPAVDALTGTRVTLHPDGTLLSTSVDDQGRREESDGTWTLDAGIVVFSVRTPERFDGEVSAARVIDTETMELSVGDSGDPNNPPMTLLLRKRS